VRWCSKAAKQEDADALFLLAQLYESGTGVPQDFRKAIEMYAKVQQSGSTLGMIKEAETALERLRESIRDNE
jgi:TPR repeat protein